MVANLIEDVVVQLIRESGVKVMGTVGVAREHYGDDIQHPTLGFSVQYPIKFVGLNAPYSAIRQVTTLTFKSIPILG